MGHVIAFILMGGAIVALFVISSCAYDIGVCEANERWLNFVGKCINDVSSNDPQWEGKMWTIERLLEYSKVEQAMFEESEKYGIIGKLFHRKEKNRD